MNYPIVVGQLIDQYYDENGQPELGPYFKVDNVFGISSEYVIIINMFELCEFLLCNEDRSEFVMKYFRIDNPNITQDQLIRNLVEYGSDVFTWWTVRKSIINSTDCSESHRVYWSNHTRINLYGVYYYNHFYESLLDMLVIKQANGMFHSVHEFINTYRDQIGINNSIQSFNDIINLICNHDKSYYSIEEIERDLTNMIYEFNNSFVPMIEQED